MPATDDNIERRATTCASSARQGGTEMLERHPRGARVSRATRSALRFVTFLTDGYIGNEVEILGEVQRTIGDARIFSFGVGNSVNRYLLDGLATEGRGTVAYLGLDDSAAEVMEYYFERISRPALTDVAIDWNGLAATDVYPARLPDLFAGRPIVVTGKFRGSGGRRRASRPTRAQRRVAFGVGRGSRFAATGAAQPLGTAAHRGSRAPANSERGCRRRRSPMRFARRRSSTA